MMPAALFSKVAASRPSALSVVCGSALWLGWLPPVCAYIGMTQSGWRLGVGEALFFSKSSAALISIGYYFALLLGFALATFLSRWLAPTYGIERTLGLHAALIAIVGTPLMIGGVLHLYPHLPFNILCLIPAILWSAYLLYSGIPILFHVDASRGMLMASALLGVIFVAVLVAATIIMMLWTHGIGPDIGFNWRSSIAG